MTGRWRAAAGLLLAAAGVAAAGCESRNHENPLDPQNGETGGRPNVLVPLAGDGSVELHWETLGLRDLEGQTLYRAADGGPRFEIATFSPGVSGWCDESAENGRTYSYTLEWRFAGGAETTDLPQNRARPGKAWVWAADVTGGGLLSVTPDGQRIRYRIGGGRSVLDLAADPGTGRVWGADYDAGEILAYDPRTDTADLIPLRGVNTVSYDAASDLLWAGSFFDEVLVALRPDGTRLFTVDGIGLIEDVDAVPGAGAVAVSRGGQIHWVDATGAKRLAGETDWPVSVAYDELLEGAWVADRVTGEILFAEPDGTSPVPVAGDLQTPVDLGIDYEGRCWVAERGGRVTRVARDAGIDLRVALDVSPEGVTVDPRSGEVWVCAPREGAIRLLDGSGVEIFRWEGSDWPKKVEAAWDPGEGPRCSN